MKKSVIRNSKSIISLRSQTEATKTRYCVNCNNPVVRDENEFHLFRCMTCGIPVHIKETSPERELNTVFQVNTSGKSSRIVSKGGNKKTSQTKLESKIEYLHDKGVNLFDFLQEQFDVNGIQVKDFKVHLPKDRTNKIKSYQ